MGQLELRRPAEMVPAHLQHASGQCPHCNGQLTVMRPASFVEYGLGGRADQPCHMCGRLFPVWWCYPNIDDGNPLFKAMWISGVITLVLFLVTVFGSAGGATAIMVLGIITVVTMGIVAATKPMRAEKLRRRAAKEDEDAQLFNLAPAHAMQVIYEGGHPLLGTAAAVRLWPEADGLRVLAASGKHVLIEKRHVGAMAINQSIQNVSSAGGAMSGAIVGGALFGAMGAAMGAAQGGRIQQIDESRTLLTVTVGGREYQMIFRGGAAAYGWLAEVIAKL